VVVEGQAICRLQKNENLRIYIYKIKNIPLLPYHRCRRLSCLHCIGGTRRGDGGHVLTRRNDGDVCWTCQHTSKGSKVYIKKLS
jgi:hypothetical protein